jgi:putative ABC transport system permease protein
MLGIAIRSAWATKRRLVGTALAVVLGVAFLTGTLVLGDTLRRNFDDLFAGTTAGTDVIVRNPTEITRGDAAEAEGSFIDAAVVDQVAGVDGVDRAVGEVTGYAAVLDDEGDAIGGNGPPRIGGNWLGDSALNPYRLVDGRAPEADDEVVVNRGTADAGDLAVGDTATVQVPAPIEVTIVGIATFGDEDGLGETTYTAFTDDAAREHLAGGRDVVSSVRVTAADGVSQDELASRVAAALPGDGVEALTGEELTDEQVSDIEGDFLGMLTTFLTVFAGIALLVAAFSIYNTFSILVAQRTREMALLRAVGAARKQVLVAVVIEALAVGLVGSVLGFAAGLGIAGLLKAVFSVAGGALPAGGMVITVGPLVMALVVGMVATLVAAIGPAVRASRTKPMAALREAALDTSGTSRRRRVAGAVVLGGGVAAVVAAAVVGGDAMLTVAGVGAVASLVGVIVAGPVIARPAASLLGAPLARFRGAEGLLARRNAMRNPRRTSATAAALMVGVGVVTVFTVFAASLTRSLEDTVDRTFAADLVVAAPAFGGAALDPQLAGVLGDLDEVSGAVGIGPGGAVVDGDERAFSVADPAGVDAVIDVGVVEGSLADLGDDEVAVADTTAEDEGWALGDTLPFTFADGGEERLTIGALYEEADLVGGMIVPPAAYVPHAAQQVGTAVYVDLADGVSPDEGRAAVEAAGEPFGAPDPQDRDEYAASLTAGLDMLLTVVYALLALAIIIALMGIANTLALSTWERRRELGVLRAVGQTRRQLRRMVRDESVLIALFGTVGGLGLGVFLGWGLVRAVGSTSDAASAFALPIGSLAVVVVVGAIAGVLAGVRPARRASRLDVLGAVAGD